VIEIDGELEKV